MHAAVRAALFCAPLLIAASAPAQDRPDSDRSDIIVTGKRDIDRHVREFVDALAPALPGGRQLARFETKVCPAALGLSPQNRAAVERRLRSVAAAAGMDVAPEGCAVNALLMVADEKKSFIEALERHHRRYLGDLTESQIRRLARADGPTAAWQMTGVATARGVRLDPSDGQAGFINRTTESPSRITAATRPVFDGSVLVVERKALTGLTATQLADYAAMRLYAKTEPSRIAGSTAPTILNILDAPIGSEVPITLSQWDLGLLRGLYSSPHNLHAGAQRSAVARQVSREIAQPDDQKQ